MISRDLGLGEGIGDMLFEWRGENDLDMSFKTSSSPVGERETMRGFGFTLGGVGSKPQNDTYNSQQYTRTGKNYHTTQIFQL